MDILNSACHAPYLYRQAATTAEFHVCLEEWIDHSEYPILYLSFHGSEQGKLWFRTIDGGADLVNHEVISDRLFERCENRVVHFGACGVLQEMDVNQFLKDTGASAVGGYRVDVDWMQSAAFDLLLLEWFQYYGRKSLTPKVAGRARGHLVEEPYSQFGQCAFLPAAGRGCTLLSQINQPKTVKPLPGCPLNKPIQRSDLQPGRANRRKSQTAIGVI
ncbi:MAG: hypothetical protein OXH52_03335 [Gammaproteobacteria bacterium]|nr:hypothetical protein [Gammaproteobacteria bacterium]